MSKLFTAVTGAVLGVATWFLLFVILGVGLGTSFIALGVIIAAGLIGAALVATRALDVPLTSTGLLAGVAAFSVLEIVLSVPMWVAVVTGLAVIGLYDICRTLLVSEMPQAESEPLIRRGFVTRPAARNGHEHHDRETVGAH